MFNSISTKIKAVQLDPVLISVALGTALALSSGPINAASQCKGLENSACRANTSCSWVEGYKRKDGKSVNSFCRAKAKPKALTKKSTGNKTTE